MTGRPKNKVKAERLTLTLAPATVEGIRELARRDRRPPITMAAMLLTQVVEEYMEGEK